MSRAVYPGFVPGLRRMRSSAIASRVDECREYYICVVNVRMTDLRIVGKFAAQR